jgi:hypothetical protein
MAETKTRASSTRGKAAKRKAPKARKASTAKSSNGASASRATKPRTSKPRTSKAKRSPASKNGTARVDAARNAVEETAKHAGHSVGDAASSVGRVASKAKTPLLAGSAAVAGVAGGIALGRNSKSRPRRPKVKIDSHDLAKAAKEVGQFGVDVGQLAAELRRNREAAHGTKKRSPIEVVLEGLTSRGHGSS